MDTRMMWYFVNTCEVGSISKAAKKLYISQQGLSSAINRLESYLGCELIERTSHGIKPTRDGEYLFGQAKKMVDIEKAIEEHFHVLEMKKRRLTIGSSFGVMEAFMDELVFGFREEYPDIEPEIIELPDLRCEDAIESNSVEVGFVIGPFDQSRFDGKLLWSSPICAVVHNTHPLATKNAIDIASLKNEPILCMNDQFKIHHKFSRCCAEASFSPTILMEAAEMSLVGKIVTKNRGVGICPMTSPPPNTKMVRIDHSGFEWDIYLAVKKNRSVTEACSLFIDYVTSHCNRL